MACDQSVELPLNYVFCIDVSAAASGLPLVCSVFE